MAEDLVEGSRDLPARIVYVLFRSRAESGQHQNAADVWAGRGGVGLLRWERNRWGGGRGSVHLPSGLLGCDVVERSTRGLA